MFLNTNTRILLLYIEVSIYIYWFNTSSHSIAWHDHVHILIVDLVVVVLGNSFLSSMLSTSVHVMRLNHIGPNSIDVFTDIFILVLIGSCLIHIIDFICDIAFSHFHWFHPHSMSSFMKFIIFIQMFPFHSCDQFFICVRSSIHVIKFIHTIKIFYFINFIHLESFICGNFIGGPRAKLVPWWRLKAEYFSGLLLNVNVD